MGVPDLEQWAVAQGQAAFRGRQLHDWLYAKGARNLDAVSVLPKAFRDQLQSQPPKGAVDWIGRSRELHRSVARDGTTKLLLGTHDGLSIETVGIPAEGRLTVCVSSQVGCPMACRFCATGKGGLQRSLAVHEIVDQVLSVREVMDQRPSHVVFMGMGEPLLNIEAVLAARSGAQLPRRRAVADLQDDAQVRAISWALDPLVRGCSHAFLPWRGADWAGNMIRPHHELHFAGEHARRLEVGMEAAVESGERAALEILQALA